MTENKLENLRKEIDVVDNKRFQKVLEKVENLAGKNGIVNYDRK